MRGFFKALAWIFGVLGVICIVLYAFFFDVWTIPSDDPLAAAAIQPTLQAGDLVVISRRTGGDRGNLLRCADTRASGRYVIARVMALPPEHIEINGETVSIDRARNPSPRGCPETTMRDPNTGEDVELTCSVEEFANATYFAYRAKNRVEAPAKADVSSGAYLVSDNRHLHDDSRDFGVMTNLSSCQHIVFRLWSAAGFTDSKHRFNLIW
jgi:signal peptidase I